MALLLPREANVHLEGARAVRAGSAGRERHPRPRLRLRDPGRHGGRERVGHQSPRPVDWYSLLEGVAREFRCSAATTHIVRDVPGQTTLLWDAMVAELAQRSPHASGARLGGEAPPRGRQAPARGRAHAPPLARLRAELPRDRLARRDELQLRSGLAGRGGAPLVRDDRALAQGLPLGARWGTRVWFPHGHQSDPSSIVLGAHAYGVRIAAMQAAFEAHARKPAPRPTEALDTWVAAALERPLLFVGLSLTREEWDAVVAAHPARPVPRAAPRGSPPARVRLRPAPLPARAPRDARRLPEPGAGLRAARSLAARLHRVCDRVAAPARGRSPGTPELRGDTHVSTTAQGNLAQNLALNPPKTPDGDGARKSAASGFFASPPERPVAIPIATPAPSAASPTESATSRGDELRADRVDHVVGAVGRARLVRVGLLLQGDAAEHAEDGDADQARSAERPRGGRDRGEAARALGRRGRAEPRLDAAVLLSLTHDHLDVDRELAGALEAELARTGVERDGFAVEPLRDHRAVDRDL
jgi:hypothetical protein